MTVPDGYRPVVTRTPEALADEAEAIAAAEAEQRRLEVERETAETDQERLLRESGE